MLFNHQDDNAFAYAPICRHKGTAFWQIRHFLLGTYYLNGDNFYLFLPKNNHNWLFYSYLHII